jgi:hypothetical protein
MSVARYCDLSLCDDHVAVLRNRELDALCDLLDVMNALACRSFVLACRKNVLDALSDLLDAVNALACRKNERAYRMCALACRMNELLDAQCVLVNDDLVARCVLQQTSLHESLALDDRPFQRRAL